MGDMRDKLVRIADDAIQPLIREWYAEEIEAEDAFAAAAVDALLVPDIIDALANLADAADAVQEVSGGTIPHDNMWNMTLAARAILSKLEAK